MGPLAGIRIIEIEGKPNWLAQLIIFLSRELPSDVPVITASGLEFCQSELSCRLFGLMFANRLLTDC